MSDTGRTEEPQTQPWWDATADVVVGGTDDHPRDRPADRADQAAIEAVDVALRSGGRDVFAPVTATVPSGALTVVSGPASSGKTSLLLTLAGRMKPAGGQLTVLGHQLPRHAARVRRRVSLAEMQTVNDLDDSLTVAQHIAERLAMQQPWWKPWVSRRRVHHLTDEVDRLVESVSAATAALVASGRHAPPQDTSALNTLERAAFVSDLTPLDRMALGVTLGLIGRPDVLVVDDIDGLRSADDRRVAWAALLTLLAAPPTPADQTPRSPLTIVASCQDTRELDGLLARQPPGTDGPAAVPAVVPIPLAPAAVTTPSPASTPRDQDDH